MVESKVGHVCVCYVDYFPFESKVGHVCVCCVELYLTAGGRVGEEAESLG